MYSAPTRSANPRHADQPVRSMAIGHSRLGRSEFGMGRGVGDRFGVEYAIVTEFRPKKPDSANRVSTEPQGDSIPPTEPGLSTIR